MNKWIKYFLVIFLLTNISYPQNLSYPRAKSFVKSLINGTGKLSKFVLPSELKLSNRLGINYLEKKNKFLISNDIDQEVKNKIQAKKLKYNYNIKSLGDNYSLLTLTVPAVKIKKEYYFYRSFLISAPYFYSRNWTERKSRYFIFHISNPKLFNDYSMHKLDSFVNEILTLLKFNQNEINKLKKEKIHYFLCKDEHEIKLLTGYDARGLYYLPYDYIISSFNCHYHEIMHLLMNYKLQQLHLYTLPFLQEGFAVAYGGRGGKEPNVILKMGLFLAKSKFLDYQSLLSKMDFYKFDASLSYPVSGLYTKFLIKTLGVNKFIQLYRKYSTDSKNINLLKIKKNDLPPDSVWQKYIESDPIRSTINISINKTEAVNKFRDTLIETKNYCIYESNNSYLFKLKKAIGLKSRQRKSKYISSLFKELYPTKSYQNQKYIVTADSNAVSVYNCYSNNLTAKYVKSFSVKNKTVEKQGDFYTFAVNKKVFDEPLKNLQAVEINR